MKFTFLGTGVAIPQNDRVQSGLIMEISSKPMLFDCGGGVLNRIFESGYEHTDIDTIVLTHLHLDHVADVLCLIKANWLCDKTDFTIYGPEGTEKWLSDLMKIYGYMQEKVDIKVTEVSEGDTFTPEGFDCNITCAAGVHSVPSLGYRVDADDVSVVYSGDTEPCKSIMDMSIGADVLIHECSFPLDFEMTNHTTPDMLVEMLKDYEDCFGSIYLTHLYPHMQGHEREAIEYIGKQFSGDIKIASDLMKIEL